MPQEREHVLSLDCWCHPIVDHYGMEDEMPYKITKASGGKVRVTSPHGTKAKATTPAKAEAQQRLLNAIEHTDWRPTGKSKRK